MERGVFPDSPCPPRIRPGSPHPTHGYRLKPSRLPLWDWHPRLCAFPSPSTVQGRNAPTLPEAAASKPAAPTPLPVVPAAQPTPPIAMRGGCHGNRDASCRLSGARLERLGPRSALAARGLGSSSFSMLSRRQLALVLSLPSLVELRRLNKRSEPTAARGSV